MIRFGSIECQEAAKATETAARGDGGVVGNVCSYCRMMDAHTRVTPVIYSVVPISVPYLQSNPTTFTNMISLQRDFMYTEEIINLICVTVYRLQLLSIILL